MEVSTRGEQSEIAWHKCRSGMLASARGMQQCTTTCASGTSICAQVAEFEAIVVAVQTNVQSFVKCAALAVFGLCVRQDLMVVCTRLRWWKFDGQSYGQGVARRRVSAHTGERAVQGGGRVRMSTSIGERRLVGLGNRCFIP